jgi:hypothetical protein
VDTATGSNIQELESTIVDCVRDLSAFPRVPRSYIELAEMFLARSEKEDTDRMSLSNFRQMCSKAGVLSSKLDEVINFLQDSGLVLLFKDSQNRGQNACLITRPQALAEVFLSLASSPLVKRGVLLLSDVFNHLWKQRYSPTEAILHVQMLKEFELVFVAETPEPHLVIPTLLPELPPLSLPSYWPLQAPSHLLDLGRLYQLSSLPKGLTSRLLFRLLHLPHAHVLATWRSGVLLDSTHLGIKVAPAYYRPASCSLRVSVLRPLRSVAAFPGANRPTTCSSR